MGVNYSPRIVTDGLVLCLDAANKKSYPGSGTSWYDLSGNRNTGTLTNGPTFSSNNNGTIVFDGVNDVVSIPNNGQFSFKGNTFSINMWIYPTSWTNTINARTLIDFESAGWKGWLIRQYGTNTYLGGNSDTRISSVLPSLNSWTNLSFTSNGTNAILYYNGIVNYSTTIYYPSNSTTSSYGIGNNSENPAQGFQGQIPLVQVYNRALSADEISQNFNALRGRYGL